jgi:hypothetical protein
VVAIGARLTINDAFHQDSQQKEVATAQDEIARI